MKHQWLAILIIVLAALPHAAIATDAAPTQVGSAATFRACNDAGVVKESADHYRIGLSHQQIEALRAYPAPARGILAVKLVQILGHRLWPKLFSAITPS